MSYAEHYLPKAWAGRQGRAGQADRQKGVNRGGTVLKNKTGFQPIPKQQTSDWLKKKNMFKKCIEHYLLAKSLGWQGRPDR